MQEAEMSRDAVMKNFNEPEPTKAGGFSYHTVLSALRCWWKIVVPVSVISAGVTAGLLLYLHKPMYTADAWLMITQNRDHLLTPETTTESAKFIQNQIEIIRSPKLLAPLLGNPEIVSTPELLYELDLTLALARQLNVKARGLSDIYVVSYTSESPKKAETIVKATVDAYLDYTDQREAEQGTKMVELLTLQREERRREMNQLRKDVRDKSIQTTGIDPFRAANKEEAAKSQNPFADLQGDIIKLQVEQDILAARIKVEEQRREDKLLEPSAQEIELQLAKHESVVTQQMLIDQLAKKVADFDRTGKNLDSNPLFKQVQAELAKHKAALETSKDGLRHEIRDELIKQMAADADAKVNKFKEEFNAGAVRLGILNAKFKEGMEAAKQFTGDTLDLEFMRAKLQQVTAIHDAINHRILQITTEQRAPRRVTLFKEATLPIRPDELYPWKKIGMGAGVAFLVPLVLCVAWEQFFGRVSSRSQLENQQLMVVGEVTSLPSRARSSAAGRAVQRDVRLFEESVDSLRTFLALSPGGHDLRTIAVVSAVSGEGKTSLAAQLAVSIARATRERTLLIDGDLRSPDIHNIFQIDVGPGLAEVLEGDCPLQEAIDTSFSDRLHILTTGRLRTNPHRLLGGGGLDEILNKLKGMYRHIVIDTPPILSASESLVFARMADTAVLCMRRDFSRLDQSQAAHARMTAAGVHISGAVLNGIPTAQYAYHYGSYEVSNLEA